MHKYDIIMLLLLIIWKPSFSQNKNVKATPMESDLHVINLSIEDGLLNSYVDGFSQSHNGAMYIATAAGLNIYDGYTFKEIPEHPKDPYSLKGLIIKDVLVDSKKRVWISTLAHGISYYDIDEKRLYHVTVKGFPKDKIEGYNFLTLGSDGKIWVAFSDNLYVYNEEKKYLESMEPWIKKSFSFKDWTDITASKNKVLFTYNGCVGSFNITTKVFNEECFLNYPDDIVQQNAKSIVADDSYLWIAKGPYLIRKHIKKPEEYKVYELELDRDKMSQINDLMIDSNNMLWVSSDDGVFTYNINTDSFTHYKKNKLDNYSLDYHEIGTLYEDQNGLIWLASKGNGLYILNPDSRKIFNYLLNKEAYQLDSENYITAILKDRFGYIWLGTRSSGLMRIDRNNQKIVHARLPKRVDGYRDTAMDIYLDMYDNLWVSTKAELYIMDPITLEVKVSYRFAVKDKKELQEISEAAILEDYNGDIWLSAYEGLFKVIKLNGKIHSFKDILFEDFSKKFKSDTGISNEEINLMHSNIDGAFWIATTKKGLLYWDNKKDISYTFTHQSDNKNSISGDEVVFIHEDKNKALWIGTRFGLDKLTYHESDIKNSYIERILENKKIPNKSVSSIASSKNGELWFTTKNGLYRYAPGNILNADLKSNENKLMRFTVLDGLKTNEFIEDCSHHHFDGELFFGTISGAISFYPDEFNSDEYKHNFVLSEVLTGMERKIDDQAIKNKKISVHEKNSMISLTASVLDFYFSDIIKYRYRLLGWSKEWVELEKRKRTIHFIGLDAGNYILEIQASNKNGQWLNPVLKIDLEVKRYFWESGTLYFLYGFILLSLIIFVIYFWYIRFKKKLNKVELNLSDVTHAKLSLLDEANALKEMITLKEKKIHHLSIEKDELEEKILSFGEKDSTTRMFNQKYFINLMSSSIGEEKNQLIDESVLIGITFLLKSQKNEEINKINYENVVFQLSDTLKDFFHGDALFCRWDEGSILVMESKALELVVEKIKSLYAIISTKYFDFGNGNLTRLTINIALLKFPDKDTLKDENSKVKICLFMEDLLAYLRNEKQKSGAYLLEIKSDKLNYSIDHYLTQGIEILLERNIFQLSKVKITNDTTST